MDCCLRRSKSPCLHACRVRLLSLYLDGIAVPCVLRCLCLAGERCMHVLQEAQGTVKNYDQPSKCAYVQYTHEHDGFESKHTHQKDPEHVACI